MKSAVLPNMMLLLNNSVGRRKLRVNINRDFSSFPSHFKTHKNSEDCLFLFSDATHTFLDFPAHTDINQNFAQNIKHGDPRCDRDRDAYLHQITYNCNLSFDTMKPVLTQDYCLQLLYFKQLFD